MKTKKYTNGGFKMKAIRIFLTVIFLLAFASMVLSQNDWTGETDSSGNFVSGSPAPTKSFSFSGSSQAWSWSTSGELLAYGYGSASVSIASQYGDNCFAQVQILLLKNGSILDSTNTVRVDNPDEYEIGDGASAYASDSHTFTADNYTGPVDQMAIKIRTYVWGCFVDCEPPGAGGCGISWYEERVYSYYKPAPLSPTNLTVTDSSGYAHLSWSGGAGAEKFVIEWDAGVYGWEQIAEINASSKSYTDYVVQTSPQTQLYKYRVKSVNWWNSNRQESGYSNTGQIWGSGPE
jgi:hypothetical protein